VPVCDSVSPVLVPRYAISPAATMSLAWATVFQGLVKVPACVSSPLEVTK